MGALILHLEEQGWNMWHPDVWSSPPLKEGGLRTLWKWKFVPGGDISDFKMEAQEVAIHQLWREASMHRNGDGLFSKKCLLISQGLGGITSSSSGKVGMQMQASLWQ